MKKIIEIKKSKSKSAKSKFCQPDCEKIILSSIIMFCPKCGRKMTIDLTGCNISQKLDLLNYLVQEHLNKLF